MSAQAEVVAASPANATTKDTVPHRRSDFTPYLRTLAALNGFVDANYRGLGTGTNPAVDDMQVLWHGTPPKKAVAVVAKAAAAGLQITLQRVAYTERRIMLAPGVFNLGAHRDGYASLSNDLSAVSVQVTGDPERDRVIRRQAQELIGSFPLRYVPPPTTCGPDVRPAPLPGAKSLWKVLEMKQVRGFRWDEDTLTVGLFWSGPVPKNVTALLKKAATTYIVTVHQTVAFDPSNLIYAALEFRPATLGRSRAIRFVDLKPDNSGLVVGIATTRKAAEAAIGTWGRTLAITYVPATTDPVAAKDLSRAGRKLRQLLADRAQWDIFNKWAVVVNRIPGLAGYTGDDTGTRLTALWVGSVPKAGRDLSKRAQAKGFSIQHRVVPYTYRQLLIMADTLNTWLYKEKIAISEITPSSTYAGIQIRGRLISSDAALQAKVRRYAHQRFGDVVLTFKIYTGEPLACPA
ncbi:hypothetical protein D1871_07895 [Nakamurella silvestris]|nr:hypothetical protein D1871_07895 [Nakamurella silvestris]